MQAGFAMLEVGSVRSKSAGSILLKNVFDTAVGSIVWWLLGYGFAYGTSHNGFIGTDEFAGTGDDFSPRDWFFQFVFASTVRGDSWRGVTCARRRDVGASVAGRCRLPVAGGRLLVRWCRCCCGARRDRRRRDSDPGVSDRGCGCGH